MTESSPEVVPNGYSFSEHTLKATDNETSVSPIASNGTSSHVVSQASENGAVGGHQEVVPVVEKDSKVADTVWPNREVGVTNFRLPLISEKGSDSWQQEVIPHVENDTEVADTFLQQNEVTVTIFGRPLVSEKRTETQHRRVENDATDTVRQNGEPAVKTKERVPSTVRREHETQVKSLHIDDDGDDNDGVLTTGNGGDVTPEHQAPGANVFALNRPHAWHQELAKKRHEPATTVDDPVIDRQVLSCIYYHMVHEVQQYKKYIKDMAVSYIYTQIQCKTLNLILNSKVITSLALVLLHDTLLV